MTEAIRVQLEDRRQRLETALASAGDDQQLLGLLREVDLALDRGRAGTYGLCETCHDPIEPERLASDPLIRLCLDHLTDAERRALEFDLDMAARVQRALLPPRDLVHGRWEFAYDYLPLGTVSGDYCDIVRPDGGGDRAFVFFGDVSGKGVAASMLMSHLHATARSLVGLGLSIDQVLERANRLFCESTIPSHYATLVCAALAPSGEVEIASAGHLPPIVVRRGHVSSLDPSGLPVGMFCASTYGVRRLSLDPGDHLLLFTDGLTEACDEDDEEYGIDRLTRAVAASGARAARDLVSRCLDDLVGFVAGAPRHDDLTVMAIRRL